MISVEELNNKYRYLIKEKCPWCGNSGKFYLTNTDTLFVRCEWCKARSPLGSWHYLKEKEIEEAVKVVTDWWNARK